MSVDSHVLKKFGRVVADAANTVRRKLCLYLLSVCSSLLGNVVLPLELSTACSLYSVCMYFLDPYAVLFCF